MPIFAWQQLSAGIEYLSLDDTLTLPWSHIHVFRIHLKKNQFELLTAKNLSLPLAGVDKFSQKYPLAIAINGGFFDSQNRPLGLRITHSTLTNPFKPISWWGIFQIRNQMASIHSSHHFLLDKQVDFAIQSGPRLIINGKIPNLRPGLAERSALGITPTGEVIILVTENAALSTTTLAQLMLAHPLNCQYALNLDGGSSSQIRAHFHQFSIHSSGLAPVSDAIIVHPRS
jgi:uncharacterized protein YigE (DUF2233 family)